VKRRALLLAGAGAAGALVVGWSVLPPRSRVGSPGLLPALDGEVSLNGWIKIGADGRVMLAMARSEMGQGVHTALAMLAAEELDVPPDSVQLVPAGHDTLYGNVAASVAALPVDPRLVEPGQEDPWVSVDRWLVRKVARTLGINVTGSSSSVADSWEPLRRAAATARGQLLGAASLRWRQPVAELSVDAGVVSHPSGLKAHYGELVAQAAATRSGGMQPKPPEQWRLIGRNAPRLDVPAKCDGRAEFGIDVRLPGLLYAAVRHAPQIGGAWGEVDANAVLARPGVERLVRLPPMAGAPAALAVVARTSWHALQATRTLPVEWTRPPRSAPNSDDIADEIARAARESGVEGGEAFLHRGDAARALAGAARRIEALYRAPYLAHAAMEPINCTARVAEGRVVVWAPTQVPGLARELAARIAGVAPEDVTVHVTYLGGAFGRRLEVDVVGQAVRVAMETGGRPVQLLWSREEDLGHDYYRPAAAAWMQAGLDAEGQLQALAFTSAGDTVTPRWTGRALPDGLRAQMAALQVASPLLPRVGALPGPLDGPDRTASEGLFDHPYAVADQRVAHVATRHDVPVGFWRSVGHSHNAFFRESFIDELAHATGQDPVAFRLSLLVDMPRHAAVLHRVAVEAGWSDTLPAGRARGVALHESFDTIVAQVVELSLPGGRPRVHRVVCAVDCGVAVNPDIVAQQMEGGVVFALSAALHGRIDIVDGVVQQTNFPQYPLAQMADTPVVETHIVRSLRPPSGVGEPGVPPLAPALANAWFALTGERKRALPLL
jgi:isoquinoline 1-oxidoreductase subunit beta